jgi:hypothetical protein
MVQDNESYHLNHWRAQHHQIQAVTQFGSVENEHLPAQRTGGFYKTIKPT